MKPYVIIASFGIKCLLLTGAIVLLFVGCATAPKAEPISLFCAPAGLTHNGYMAKGLMCRSIDETYKAIDEQIQEDQVKPQSTPINPRTGA